MQSMSRADTKKLLEKLKETYPDAKCALHFNNPFELLIATMLSAQCTDIRVNMVTEKLFKKYHGPSDYIKVSSEILQEDIKEVGLFRTKSENIIATCKILLEKFAGNVPKNREDLVSLPGVGRKTANVVLSNAFGIPALAVDTHVQRVSNRLGLANSMTPEMTEKQICQIIPKEMWSDAHHWLIHHGRAICSARNPKCDICPIQEFCHFYRKLQKDSKLNGKVFVKKKVHTTEHP